MAIKKNKNPDASLTQENHPSILLDCGGRHLFVEPPSIIPDGYTLSREDSFYSEKVGWHQRYSVITVQRISTNEKPIKKVRTVSNDRGLPTHGDAGYRRDTVSTEVTTYEFPVVSTVVRIEPAPSKDVLQDVKKLYERYRTSTPLPMFATFESATPPSDWNREVSTTIDHIIAPNSVTSFEPDQEDCLLELLDSPSKKCDGGKMGDLPKVQAPLVWPLLPQAKKSAALGSSARDEISKKCADHRKEILSIFQNDESKEINFSKLMEKLDHLHAIQNADIKWLKEQALLAHEQERLTQEIKNRSKQIQKILDEIKSLPQSDALVSNYESITQLRKKLEST